VEIVGFGGFPHAQANEGGPKYNKSVKQNQSHDSVARPGMVESSVGSTQKIR
jgi:hypothetical protein